MNEARKETKQYEKKENLNDLMIKTKPSISFHQNIVSFSISPEAPLIIHFFTAPPRDPPDIVAHAPNDPLFSPQKQIHD